MGLSLDQSRREQVIAILKLFREFFFLGARAPLGIGHVCMYVCMSVIKMLQIARDSPR